MDIVVMSLGVYLNEGVKDPLPTVESANLTNNLCILEIVRDGT